MPASAPDPRRTFTRFGHRRGARSRGRAQGVPRPVPEGDGPGFAGCVARHGEERALAGRATRTSTKLALEARAEGVDGAPGMRRERSPTAHCGCPGGPGRRAGRFPPRPGLDERMNVLDIDIGVRGSTSNFASTRARPRSSFAASFAGITRSGRARWQRARGRDLFTNQAAIEGNDRLNSQKSRSGSAS